MHQIVGPSLAHQIWCATTRTTHLVRNMASWCIISCTNFGADNLGPGSGSAHLHQQCGACGGMFLGTTFGAKRHQNF